MYQPFRSALLFLFAVLFLPALLSAGVTDPKAVIKLPDSEQAINVNPQLQMARQLMSAHEFQAAADILEVLYESYPDNSIISNSLKSCYEQSKQFAKGEILLRRLCEQFPQNPSYKLNLAENLVYQGKTDEGKELYKTLYADFNPKNPVAFTNVVRSMIYAGIEDDAFELIGELRKESGDTTLMAIERARILEGKRKYTEAAQEYILILPDTTRTGSTAEKNLAELLDFPESKTPTEKKLMSRIDSDPSGRVLKILSSYFLKTGRYDEAFDFAVRQDSAVGMTGASLLEYLRGCMERKLYNQAIRMCEYVLSNIKNKPFLNEFYYRYAESLEELGFYNKAISVYDTILTTFPARNDKAEAAYRIGRIHMERFNNPEMALKFFDSVKTHYVAGFGYNNALMSVPHAYLQMGDLKNARREFQNISKSRRSGESVEEADYYLALVDFFDHNYDSTTAALKKLMVDFPKGYLVNDAIQLSFTIDQAEGAEDLLNFFAGALLFQEMKLYDSTVSRLTSIADAENKALADIALFRLTETMMKRGDSVSVVKTVDRLENEHPESYYLPYGLKTKADILFSKSESMDEAKEIYRRLLENYQNYPFINEIREKMRKLETAPKPS